MGFEEAATKQALSRCGPSLTACVDFCLAQSLVPAFGSATEKEPSTKDSQLCSAPVFDSAVDEAEQLLAGELLEGLVALALLDLVGLVRGRDALLELVETHL